MTQNMNQIPPRRTNPIEADLVEWQERQAAYYTSVEEKKGYVEHLKQSLVELKQGRDTETDPDKLQEINDEIHREETELQRFQESLLQDSSSLIEIMRYVGELKEELSNYVQATLQGAAMTVSAAHERFNAGKATQEDLEELGLADQVLVQSLTNLAQRTNAAASTVASGIPNNINTIPQGYTKFFAKGELFVFKDAKLVEQLSQPGNIEAHIAEVEKNHTFTDPDDKVMFDRVKKLYEAKQQPPSPKQVGQIKVGDTLVFLLGGSIPTTPKKVDHFSADGMLVFFDGETVGIDIDKEFQTVDGRKVSGLIPDVPKGPEKPASVTINGELFIFKDPTITQELSRKDRTLAESITELENFNLFSDPDDKATFDRLKQNIEANKPPIPTVGDYAERADGQELFLGVRYDKILKIDGNNVYFESRPSFIIDIGLLKKVITPEQKKEEAIKELEAIFATITTLEELKASAAFQAWLKTQGIDVATFKPEDLDSIWGPPRRLGMINKLKKIAVTNNPVVKDPDQTLPPPPKITPPPGTQKVPSGIPPYEAHVPPTKKADWKRVFWASLDEKFSFESTGHKTLIEGEENGAVMPNETASLKKLQQSMDEVDASSVKLAKEAQDVEDQLRTLRKEEKYAKMDADDYLKKGAFSKMFSRDPRGKVEKLTGAVKDLEQKYSTIKETLGKNDEKLTAWKDERKKTVDGFVTRVNENFAPIENKLRITREEKNKLESEIRLFELRNKKYKIEIAKGEESMRTDFPAGEFIANLNRLHVQIRDNEETIAEAYKRLAEIGTTIDPLERTLRERDKQIERFKLLNTKVEYVHRYYTGKGPEVTDPGIPAGAVSVSPEALSDTSYEIGSLVGKWKQAGYAGMFPLLDPALESELGLPSGHTWDFKLSADDFADTLRAIAEKNKKNVDINALEIILEEFQNSLDQKPRKTYSVSDLVNNWAVGYGSSFQGVTKDVAEAELKGVLKDRKKDDPMTFSQFKRVVSMLIAKRQALIKADVKNVINFGKLDDTQIDLIKKNLDKLERSLK